MGSQRDGNTFQTGAFGELMLGVNSAGKYAPLAATAPAATFVFGQKAVAAAGTAEALVGDTAPLGVGIWIRAHAGNTGDIYVGLSTVDDATGFVLDGGESVFIPVNDAELVFIDSDENADGVSFIGY